jgi:hypothetical protein
MQNIWTNVSEDLFSQNVSESKSSTCQRTKGMCRRNNALTEKKSGPKRIRIERVVIKKYRDYSIGTKLNRVKKKSAIC